MQELRNALWATRAAITAPLVAVRIRVADAAIVGAAEGVVAATYATREASDVGELAAARAAAVRAHDLFVEAAARLGV
ncbi:hypothetical protein [Embleya sp. AB8]|uniref:hypothetical protein n=1 Tax=Embleya sp. AB8 TaxID=3156304 RepID=UPI003C70CE76